MPRDKCREHTVLYLVGCPNAPFGHLSAHYGPRGSFAPSKSQTATPAPQSRWELKTTDYPSASLVARWTGRREETWDHCWEYVGECDRVKPAKHQEALGLAEKSEWEQPAPDMPVSQQFLQKLRPVEVPYCEKACLWGPGFGATCEEWPDVW